MREETEIKKIPDEGPDNPEKVDRLNKFSFENRNTNPAFSHEVAAKAFEISTSINYVKGKADSLLNCGFYFMHASEHEKAFARLVECATIYNELLDEKGIADTQYNLGLVHLRIGNFDEAIDAFLKSLSYRESQNDLNGMAACYFQMSYIYQNFDDLEEADIAIKKALDLRIKLNDNTGKAAALMVLGEIALKKNDLVNAKIALGESLELRRNSGEQMGYFATSLRWTELHILLNDFTKARIFCTEGFELASGAKIHFGILRFLQMFAKLELAMGNIAEAKIKLTEAFPFAEKYSFKSIAFELHQAMGELCEREGDYKGALEHLKLYNKLKEEVISFQSNTRLKSAQLLGKIEFAQKEAELEKTKNSELNEAYKIISEKNKEITDSINYARRIQQGILPSEEELKKSLKNYFVLYRPKDIVSGDFFWASRVYDHGKEITLVAAIDCTGHGVPGAFMSMLGKTLLNQTTKIPKINSPATVLNYLNEELPKTITSGNQEMSIRDGMDMALCAIDFANMKLHFSGANNPCWIVRDAVLIELKPEKQAITASTDIEKKVFSDQKFLLQKNDCIYLFTDGYADQFGGPKGKKFKYKQLKEILISNSHKEMHAQSEILASKLEEWKTWPNESGCSRDLEQVDDVCIIGIRI